MPRKLPPKSHVFCALGSLIKKQRLSRGLSGADLAALVGVAHRTVRQYELGHRCPSIEMLIAIANACDKPLSQFLSPLDTFRVPLREPKTKVAS